MPDTIHIWSILLNNPSILQKSPPHYDMFMFLVDPQNTEKLRDNPGSDNRIQLNGSEEDLRMGPTYQSFQEEEMICIQYLEKMISEEDSKHCSSSVGRLKLFLPQPNRNS